MTKGSFRNVRWESRREVSGIIIRREYGHEISEKA